MKVLIYRDDLFLPSEPFVWDARNYPDGFDYWLACSRLAFEGGGPQPVLAPARRGAVARAAMRLFGVHSPSFSRELLGSTLVHAHFAVDAASLLPVLRQVSTPLIVSLHGHDVLCSDQTLATRGLRGRLLISRRAELVDRASVFLCSSHYLKARAVEAGYPQERTIVHYIGHEVDTAVRSEKPDDPVPRILFVGRLASNKGADLVVPLSKWLYARGVDHRIDVIGSGPLAALLRTKTASNGLPIRLLPPQNQRALHSIMRSSTVVFVPSRPIATGESEALNLVALEAGALGVPVVANATGGIPEVVFDGETGLLADPGAPEELFNSVERVLVDTELRARLSNSGLAFSQFERRYSRERLIKLYESLA